MKLDDLPQPERETTVHPDELEVDGDNPNQQTDDMFDLLCENMRKKGWLGNHIIANTDGLIADGEHRWRAAKEIGLEEVPVRFFEIDDTERRLWRQELNKISGFHDKQRDALEYQELLDSGRSDDLMNLVEATGEDLDDTLALLDEEEPRHLLYDYDDSNNVYFEDCIEGMQERLDDNSVDMVFTSPPYNIDLGGSDDDYMRGAEAYEDSMSDTEYRRFINKIFDELVRVVKPEGHIFWNIGFDYSEGHVEPPYWMVEDMDLPLRSYIVWNKDNTGRASISMQANGRFAGTWEPIYHFAEDPGPLNGNRNFSVWEASQSSDEHGHDTGVHPAPFSVELVTIPMMATTEPGDVILDPFMGSGTSAVAAIFNDRDYIGFELDEENVYQPIVERRISEAKRQVEAGETDKDS